MKADYKNWMPRGMVIGTGIGGLISLMLLMVIGISTMAGKVFLVITILFVIVTLWMIFMYRAFSYNGKRQLSRQIIEGIAAYVDIPDGGRGLDVGCGSGALTIACAKRNPKAQLVGIDRWGKEYASFSKDLCENNAMAEGASNVSFAQGDATKIDFDDEIFDAVTSNYVYHNIPSRNRQDLLLETLRTLKKGGTFAIHDIMSKARYGNMEEFVGKLKDMGYEEVKLIDTTSGMFMSRFEALWMELSGSTLLVGKK